MEKKLKNKKIILLSVIIFLVTILGVLIVIKNNSNGGQTETPNNDDNIVLDKDSYMTADGRFILKIVDAENAEAKKAAKERYGKEYFDSIILPFVKKYAYINDKVIAIDSIVEDEKYAVYSFIGFATEEYGHKVMVNKTNKTIEVSNEDIVKVGLDCLDNGFCGFQEFPSFIKVSTGYFFSTSDNGMITIYTSNWEKIGYIDSLNNLVKDNDGVYVYKNVEKSACNGNYCNYVGVGETVKYDVNGHRK